MLVLFIVALASVIVVNLTYTSTLEARTNLIVERGLKAEYLLKSAVNFARVLVMKDETPSVDGPQDVWAFFVDGREVPTEWLGIADPALTISMEIRPEDAKMPLIRVLRDRGGTWRARFTRLFQALGFDEDEEKDHTGLLNGRILNSEQLVAALIDYMDKDEDTFTSEDSEFSGVGIEGSLPKDTFPNQGTIRQVGELSGIPGFTPSRVRKLMPFVRTVRGGNQININFAPKRVLLALDEELGEEQAQAIIDFRGSEEGPFGDRRANIKEDLIEIVGSDLADRISGLFDRRSRQFQIIAKVDYGTSTYFARAYISKSGDRSEPELPALRSLEMY